MQAIHAPITTTITITHPNNGKYATLSISEVYANKYFKSLMEAHRKTKTAETLLAVMKQAEALYEKKKSDGKGSYDTSGRNYQIVNKKGEMKLIWGCGVEESPLVSTTSPLRSYIPEVIERNLRSARESLKSNQTSSHILQEQITKIHTQMDTLQAETDSLTLEIGKIQEQLTNSIRASKAIIVSSFRPHIEKTPSTRMRLNISTQDGLQERYEAFLKRKKEIARECGVLGPKSDQLLQEQSDILERLAQDAKAIDALVLCKEALSSKTHS